MNNIFSKSINIYYFPDGRVDNATMRVSFQEEENAMEVTLITRDDNYHLVFLRLHGRLTQEYRIDDDSICERRFYIEGVEVNEQEWKNHVQEDDRVKLNDLTEELFVNAGL